MRDESFTFEHVKHFNLKLVNFMVGRLNDMGFYKKICIKLGLQLVKR